MAVRFILGRAGTGKTRRCIDEALAALAEIESAGGLTSGAPAVILLVPEQASFQTERTLALRSPRGGFCSAAVLSFSQLARRVWALDGGEPEWLSATGRRLGLHAVLQAHRPDLQALRRTAEFPGFAALLGRQIETWLSEGLRPEELTSAGDAALAAGRLEYGGHAKLSELAALYRAYLDWLGPERADPQQRLARLRARLDASSWLSAARIWVDGFSGFTGEELETLAALTRLAREVTIALLVDPQSADPGQLSRSPPAQQGLFYRTQQTCVRLRQRLAAEGVSVREVVTLSAAFAPRFRGVPALARLEEALACGERYESSGAAPAERSLTAPAGHDVRLLACPSHRAELSAAARFIRQRVAEAGGALRYRDFAVITRDLRPFAELVREVFAEYELPCFLDQRRALRGHPLGRLLLGALEATRTGLPLGAMISLLQSGLAPLSREAAERLEALARDEEASGWSFWQCPAWPNEPPEVAAGRRALVAGLAELLPAASTRLLEEPRATGRDWAERLFRLLDRFQAAGTIAAWIAAARKSGEPERAELQRLAWEGHSELLTELHALLGQQPLTSAEVQTLLEAALAERTLALAPPGLDQVLVSAIDRSRHPDIKYAWVFALNEGLFPPPPGEDVLLSATERRSLGLEALQPRADDLTSEALLAYIAMTRASNGLVLSYAERDAAGEPLPPSPLLMDVQRALPDLRAEPLIEDAPPVSLAEAAWRLLQSPDARTERLGAELLSEPRTAEPLARLLRGRDYGNRPAAVGNYRQPAQPQGRAPAGDNPPAEASVIWEGSPSEANTVIQCPFQHFARYGLQLSEAAGADRLARDLGDAAHGLLADFTRRLLRVGQGRNPGELDEEAWQACFEEAAAALWAGFPADLARRRPRFAYLLMRQIELTREVAAAHVARWKRGDFRPWAVELGFGRTPYAAATDATTTAATATEDAPGAPWPALRIALDEAQVALIRGQIDRLDRARCGQTDYLLIYDYKLTAETAQPAQLTGYGLQMMTYLAAVSAAREQSGAEPGGVLQAPLTPNRAVIGNVYFEQSSPEEQRMHLFQPRGLLRKEMWRVLDKAYSTGRSPVAYIQLKKDGEPYAKCDLAPAARLADYIRLAQETLRLAAETIAAGRIDVAPLVIRRQRACRFCEFGPVCRVDRVFNPGRRAEEALPVLNDAHDGTTERD